MDSSQWPVVILILLVLSLVLFLTRVTILQTREHKSDKEKKMAYGDRPAGKAKAGNNKYGPSSVAGEMACGKDKGKGKRAEHDPSIKKVESKFNKGKAFRAGGRERFKSVIGSKNK